ncbi:hypothetical protein EBS80_02205 [bacterium]|nr:hypothetical protein [bacterium]
MNPREALKVLIEEVDLDPEQQRLLLSNLSEMDDASVVELGTALAQYRLAEEEAAKRTLAAIDALSEIDQIER